MAGQNAAEVIQSRDGIVYTEPYSSSNVMPADSAWGTAPGGSWVDKGFTDGGLDVRFSATYNDVHVDQNIYPIFTIGTAGDVHLVTTLAQLTIQNLKDASGQGTITTVNATSGVRGHSDLAFDGTIAVNYATGYFDIRNTSGDNEAIRIVLWKAIAKGNPQPKFTGTAKATIPLDLQGYPDTANSSRVLTWRDILAALP